MEEKSHGGARKGAGRKPKADEVKIAEQMDEALDSNQVWASLSFKVIEGDIQAIRLWLNYRFGMPKQIIENTNVNIEEKDLTDEEIKRIKDNINKNY